MIDPSECFAAPISDAAKGTMTFVLPRTNFEYRCLVVREEDKAYAICLDEVHQLGRFFSFPCDENDKWHGLHIPNVRIELDETGLHDAQGYAIPLGSMVRTEDKLTLRVRKSGNYHSSVGSVTLLEKLPTCPPHQTASFLKWSIVLGSGQDRRVLAKVDATPKEN